MYNKSKIHEVGINNYENHKQAIMKSNSYIFFNKQESNKCCTALELFTSDPIGH